MTDEPTRREIGAAVLRVVQDDITTLDVDAVVNAANERLAHGGGVAAALARAGGDEVQRESDDWVAEHGPVRPGTAAVTTAGRMPARMIIHVVGPRYRDDHDNAALLEQAVCAALDAADGADATSIALPAISAGIFGYPPPEATAVIARTCATWLSGADRSIRDVALVGYDTATAEMFLEALRHVP